MQEGSALRYQLLADAGATKTEWCLVSHDAAPAHLYTAGINANALSDEEIRRVLADLQSQLPVPPAQVDYLFFGGAGCGNPLNAERMLRLLSEIFPTARKEVFSDLMAACRATCGQQPGLVAIIGTGASSCLYDGTKISAQAPSLGWLLGDEGSGVYLGKMLITAYLHGELSPIVTHALEERYALTPTQTVRNIASDPHPNRFFATFPPFIHEFLFEDSVNQLCHNVFREFFRRFVLCYADYQSYNLNFVGSVAFAFQEVIKQVAAEHHVTTSVFLKAPMEQFQFIIHNA